MDDAEKQSVENFMKEVERDLSPLQKQEKSELAKTPLKSSLQHTANLKTIDHLPLGTSNLREHEHTRLLSLGSNLEHTTPLRKELEESNNKIKKAEFLVVGESLDMSEEM